MTCDAAAALWPDRWRGLRIRVAARHPPTLRVDQPSSMPVARRSSSTTKMQVRAGCGDGIAGKALLAETRAERAAKATARGARLAGRHEWSKFNGHPHIGGRRRRSHEVGRTTTNSAATTSTSAVARPVHRTALIERGNPAGAVRTLVGIGGRTPIGAAKVQATEAHRCEQAMPVCRRRRAPAATASCRRKEVRAGQAAGHEEPLTEAETRYPRFAARACPPKARRAAPSTWASID